MNDDDDGDLRQRFVALRKTVSDRAPTFASTRNNVEERRPTTHPTAPRFRFAMAAALVLVTAAIAFSRMIGPSSTPAGSTLSEEVLAGNWIAPTDFLLDVPGASYLRTVPTIGAGVDSFAPRLPASPIGVRSPDSRNQS